MVETEIALGAFETFLDGPTQTRRAREFGEPDALSGEDEIIGAFAGVFPIAPSQNPTLKSLVDRPRQGVPSQFVDPDRLTQTDSARHRSRNRSVTCHTLYAASR